MPSHLQVTEVPTVINDVACISNSYLQYSSTSISITTCEANGRLLFTSATSILLICMLLMWNDDDITQTYQVSRILQETPTFWTPSPAHLPHRQASRILQTMTADCNKNNFSYLVIVRMTKGCWYVICAGTICYNSSLSHLPSNSNAIVCKCADLMRNAFPQCVPFVGCWT